MKERAKNPDGRVTFSMTGYAQREIDQIDQRLPIIDEQIAKAKERNEFLTVKELFDTKENLLRLRAEHLKSL